MRINLRTVKQLIDFRLPIITELVAKINTQLGGIEQIINFEEKYKNIYIVKIVKHEKHPDADKLSICWIDDNGAASDVERDHHGLVRVVCGAPNAKADMWAVWLAPQATLPSTFGTPKELVLEARELRGILSNGMLAAGDELDINADHDGIVELTERDLPKGQILQAGANFAEVFGLDDYVIDIENKMFTHRPDCFGHLGVAREVAGIFGEPFSSPIWYKNLPDFGDDNDVSLTVFNDTPKTAPRFLAVVIDDIKIQPSPFWLQCQLASMGSKPINNIVDLTNYVMLMTAQPTHAYDYHKLSGQQLGVRLAEKGETLTLLNGKTYKLSPQDTVIVDGAGPIGLAGIMGGNTTEISQTTKTIVLECATFDMYALRKSSMRHGLFTDALTRFNKGQSPLQNPYILAYLMNLIDGKQASEVFDVRGFVDDQDNDYSKWQQHNLAVDFINLRLGTDLSGQETAKLLKNVEFQADYNDETQTISYIPPFWRTDIELNEDIVEEVGRLNDFAKIPRQLPIRDTAPATDNPFYTLKKEIRTILSRFGANEVLSYSFVHQNILKNAHQDSQQAYQLSNALSPELQFYRLSVLPSLLDKVHMNIKAGYDEFVLFEIGKGHDKSLSVNFENLPPEPQMVDLVYASKKPKKSAAYYQMNYYVRQLLEKMNLEYKLVPMSEDNANNRSSAFNPSRSAEILVGDEQIRVGWVGELKSSVVKNFRLPEYTAAATIDLDQIIAVDRSDYQSYKPLSKYPSLSQDISIRLANQMAYSQVFELVQTQLAKLNHVQVEISPLAIYQSDEDKQTKTITFRLKFSSNEMTLSDRDVAPIMQDIGEVVGQELDAVIV